MNWIPYLAALMPLGLFCLWLWLTVFKTGEEIRDREDMD